MALTHTGTKPIVCQICSKRFGSSKQMMAHYATHREARLQEFAILTKRRQPDLVSEPSSETTVGSFHGVPRSMKSYFTEPPDYSYGTDQSFLIKKDGDSHVNLKKKYAASEGFNKKVEKLPEIKIVSKGTVQQSEEEGVSIPLSLKLPKIIPKQKIPQLDAGHIRSIDNVMGHARSIETSDQSHFIENTERELIRSRLDEVSRAGRPHTPLSFRTRSGVTEYRKPKYLVDKEFWDTGSTVTDRFSGYSPVSGYDPFSKNPASSSTPGGRKTSAFTLPSLR